MTLGVFIMVGIYTIRAYYCICVYSYRKLSIKHMISFWVLLRVILHNLRREEYVLMEGME